MTKVILKRKLNILFPFVGATIGGSHISTICLAKELIKLKHKVCFVADSVLQKKRNLKKLPFKELNISHNYSSNKFYIIYLILINLIKILFFLRKHNYDLIHINDHRTGYYWILPATIFKIPIVYHYRTRWIESRLMRFFLKRTNKIICISKYVKSTLPIEFQEKSYVFLNCFDEPLKLKKKIKRKKNVILYFGSINKQKNVITFCKMADELLKTRNDLVFKIVGRKSEYFEEIEKYIIKKKIMSYFIFSDFTNDISALLKNADLVVAPAVNEGFGRTIVESMLHRVPVIASNSGGHREIIKSNYNGLLADPLDYSSYVEQVKRILSDANLKRRFVQKAYLFAISNFVKKNNINTNLLIEKYQNIL